MCLALTCVLACGGEPELESVVAGGPGPPTLVLLHGYASSPEEWLPFTMSLDWPLPARFVFPRAPEATLAPLGRDGGWGWWALDLHALVPPGEDLPDLSHERPAALHPMAERVAALVRARARETGGPVVLGGFSQGAMVASEVAFRTSAPIAGLVLLSGTPVDEESWRAHYAGRRGLPTFLAHGRQDTVLPFAGSQRMQHELGQAGLAVTWHPFQGGHEMPAEVVLDLNAFLSRVRATF